MAVMYPGQYNTFIPNLEASGKLLVDYSRNPRDFSLNKYIQIVTTPEMIGYYIKMTVEERMRILNTNLAEHQWADGHDAPVGNEGQESFNFLSFTTQRYSYQASIGKLASDQAAWDIIGQHTEIKAQQAMTARSLLTNTAIAAASWGDNTATTTVAGGGAWTAATTANLYIKKSIDYALNVILKATGGVVKMNDLQLVVNPALAIKMAESQEMVDYLKGSPDALRYVRGETGGSGGQSNVRFGLPETYAGVNIVVEDAVRVSTKKGTNTQTYGYVLADANPYIVSRPGGLVGKYGGPSFSTVTLFVYKGDDMTVETKTDTDNRKTHIRVVDNCVPIVTSTISGFRFTGAM